MNLVNGALDISIMKTPFGAWQSEHGDHFTGLQILPEEWEDLFVNVLGVRETTPRANHESFSEYDTRVKASFQESVRGKGYEMLGRVWDIYQDARYLPSEVPLLLTECEELRRMTKTVKARQALDKLASGCNEALRLSAGLVLLSD